MSSIEFGYTPAILKNQPSHGWLIEYYVINPSTSNKQRFVIKLNKLRKRFDRLSDFKKFANAIVIKYNCQLAGGWTPFGENQNSRYFTPLVDVVNEYIAEKSKELRPNSVRCYKFFASVFIAWIQKNVPGIQICNFNKVLAVRFMDYIFNDRGLTDKSWNNFLKSSRAFFSWAVGKCYAKENPFVSMKMKRESEKKRCLIPVETRKRITEWCTNNNIGMLMVCELVYSSLIRPNEITGLRIGDIDLRTGVVHVRPEVSKTHYGRFSAISPQLDELFRSMHIEKYDSSLHLFGKGYKPSATPLVRSRFSKDWIKMRNALGLPEEMQLYSLRDTGINEMIKAGIDPLTVMQHADHHDLSMTTKYANHIDPNLVETIRKKAPGF